MICSYSHHFYSLADQCVLYKFDSAADDDEVLLIGRPLAPHSEKKKKVTMDGVGGCKNPAAMCRLQINPLQSFLPQRESGADDSRVSLVPQLSTRAFVLIVQRFFLLWIIWSFGGCILLSAWCF